MNHAKPVMKCMAASVNAVIVSADARKDPADDTSAKTSPAHAARRWIGKRCARNQTTTPANRSGTTVTIATTIALIGSGAEISSDAPAAEPTHIARRFRTSATAVALKKRRGLTLIASLPAPEKGAVSPILLIGF